MTHTLIVKLNATGDVVRTSTLLHRLQGPVTWISARANLPLLQGVHPGMRVLAWEDREQATDTRYDLAISLEDELETAQFVQRCAPARVFGATLADGDRVTYSEDASAWFDMSLVSRFGRKRADELKLINRRSYQELIFSGLGWTFAGENCKLPRPTTTDLQGDVAIAPVAGPVWPMKTWAHYDALQRRLEAQGLRVNVLPKRATLLEHLGDIANHRCLVSGDSLPMHLALGLGIPCVTIFNCTSPWEIHDYGLQTKLVSPLLAEFFYKRGMDTRATTAIGLDAVFNAVLRPLQVPAAVAPRESPNDHWRHGPVPVKRP
jgi:heptosyltransferase II